MGLGKLVRKVGGNIGRAVKKAGGDIGRQAVRSAHDTGAILDNKYTKMALAAGLAATGVGAPLAAGIMATSGALGGGLKKGGGLKSSLKGGAIGAATGAGASLAGGAVRGGLGNLRDIAGEGIQRAGGKLAAVGGKGLAKNVAMQAAKGAGKGLLTGQGATSGAVTGAFGAMVPRLSGGPQPTPSFAGGTGAVTGVDAFGNKTYDTGAPGSTVETNSPDQLAEWARMDAEAAGGAPSGGAPRFRGLDSFIDIAQAGGQAYDAYQTGKRTDELYKRGRADWDARAPLRTAGQAGMLGSQRPDLSGLFAQPEQRYRRVNVGSRG